MAQVDGGPLKIEIKDRSRLQALISAKLTEIIDSKDEVLPEYVMVMIDNKKTREQVTTDLGSFLGQNAAFFTHWLWEAASVNRVTTEVMVIPQERMEISQQEEPQQRVSVFSSVVVPEGKKETSSQRERRHKKNNRIPSRMVLSAAKEAADATRETDDRHLESQGDSLKETRPRRKMKGKSSFERRIISKEEEDNNGMDMDGRAGRKTNGLSITVTLDGKKKKRKETEKSDPIESESQMNVDGGGTQSDLTESPKKIKLIRCTFWPNCSRGESCPYHHPTEPCKNFPNCTYGDSCLFFHPLIPCTFGSKCTRPDCTFFHAPASTAIASTACRFGFACIAPKCSFKHPAEACKFGKNCTNKSCVFSHATLCKFASKCTRPACSFAHLSDKSSISCKFGDSCMFKDTTCKFSHGSENMMNDEDTTKLSDSLPKTPPHGEQESILIDADKME